MLTAAIDLKNGLQNYINRLAYFTTEETDQSFFGHRNRNCNNLMNFTILGAATISGDKLDGNLSYILWKQNPLVKEEIFCDSHSDMLISIVLAAAMV
ncbi:CLUMA_CG012273, isoform A [Clunio marinus]|uniref:CLUMA_CG012273, isoform A n=1 Tax=Clunio marinus TaxID=568069 RepID=A0A1J1IFQ3_9DIPT|nr:CLUMA_CG012273, isoform A [Clunio marinus]